MLEGIHIRLENSFSINWKHQNAIVQKDLVPEKRLGAENGSLSLKTFLHRKQL